MESLQLGLQNHVKFLGPRNDIHEILSILDVYVFPSLSEGMPLAVLEAMAANKPIVATAVGGTKEAIIHGHSGLLVPPKDHEALVEAILSILKDPNLKTYLAKNAYLRFSENFTIEKMILKYEELYALYRNETDKHPFY